MRNPGVRAIAARLGLSRDTVPRAVKSGSPPKYVWVKGLSAFDPFEGHVRQLLAEFPAGSGGGRRLSPPAKPTPRWQAAEL
jgi:hypothetical protein